MKLSSQQVLQKAIEAHKAGKLREADRLYTAILKAQPTHSDANHNLGMLAVGTGKLNEALPFLKNALDANPRIAQFWLSYINVLIQLGRTADAKAFLDKAKQNGVTGDPFDQLEKTLSETTAPKDPSKDQLRLLISLHSRGLFQEALEQTEVLVKHFPTSADLLNIQGALLKEVGKLDQSIAVYKKALSIKPDYADVFNNMANVLREQGKLGEAIKAYEKALSIKPDYAEAYKNLGVTLQDQGQLEKAIQAYDSALSIKPDHAEAYYNKGNAYNQLGKLEDALAAYNKAITINPNYAEAYNSIGVALQYQAHLAAAIKTYVTACTLKPDYAEAYYNMGHAYHQLGKLEDALAAYNKAITINPNYAQAYNNMGVTLHEQGQVAKAIDVFKNALSIRPDYAEAYFNLGNALKQQSKLKGAIQAYTTALTFNPGHVKACNNMGVTYKEQGNLEGARQAFIKALAIEPTHAEAHRSLSGMLKYKPDDDQIKTVSSLLESSQLNDPDRCALSYAYAKMNEDIGELSKAFDHYVIGGKLKKKLLAYDFSQDEDLFERLKLTSPTIKKFALDNIEDKTSHTPIFILGMPRSGTTLVEQIISSHSNVTGAGELAYASNFGSGLIQGLVSANAETVKDFRHKYLTELKTKANGRRFVTDKMPQNFKLIALICASFPEAKIIHVQRNAAATCWSNFKHFFSSNGLGYSYTLRDTIKYYKLYLDLMDYWNLNFPGRIYSLNYDKLTENQEVETRQLIQHIGLNWEDACLSPEDNKRSVRTASNQQIRKKVYKGSSEAWKKFEPFLSDVFDEYYVSK